MTTGRLYCQSQGCDWSFEAHTSASLPWGCPKCGATSFASEPKLLALIVGETDLRVRVAELEAAHAQDQRELERLRAIEEAAKYVGPHVHAEDYRWRNLRDALTRAKEK